mmetsp:Transcript_113143/g.320516  ORF Transcript_113143/g.320516 Transcript_113143/m.320516 type:complete len:512 (-) Transcript_113143:26-1561(-)
MYPPLWALAGVEAAQHGEDAVAHALLLEEPVTHDGHSCHSYISLIDEEICDMMKDDCVDKCRNNPDCNYIFDNKVDFELVVPYWEDRPCNGGWQCKMLRECDLVPTRSIHDKVVEVRRRPPAGGTTTKAPLQEGYSHWLTLGVPFVHVLTVLWAAYFSRCALWCAAVELAVVVFPCFLMLLLMKGRSSWASVDFRVIAMQSFVQAICCLLMFVMFLQMKLARDDVLGRLASMRDRERSLEKTLLDRVEAKGRTLDEQQRRETTANFGIALVFAAPVILVPFFVYTRMMTPEEEEDQSVWMRIHNGVSQTLFGQTGQQLWTVLAILATLVAIYICSSFAGMATKFLLRCARSSTLVPADDLRTLAYETRATAIAVEETVIAKIAMHDHNPEGGALSHGDDGESLVARHIVRLRGSAISAQQQSIYVEPFITARALDVLERKITQEFETQRQLNIAHVNQDDAAVDMAFDQARTRMNDVQAQGTRAASAAGRAAAAAGRGAFKLARLMRGGVI